MITRVLDTNVLLDRPLQEIVNSFEPCKIVIPIPVLIELDTFKTSQNPNLRLNSRAASRYIDKLRSRGDLHEGVILPSGHAVKIELNFSDIQLPFSMDASKADFRILQVCMGLKEKGEDVILCTQDTNERIFADVLGIRAESYGDSVNLSSLYKGWRHLNLGKEAMISLLESGGVEVDIPFLPNEFLITSYGDDYMVGRYNGSKIESIDTGTDVYGVKAINTQQECLVDLLLDPNIKLVTAIGGAGSGKTLLSLAAGIDQTDVIGSTGRYSKVLVMRPQEPIGREIGFLPGSEQQKVGPWLGAIFDNLEFLTSKHVVNKKGTSCNSESAVAYLMDYDRIDLRALTFIRGRSIPRQFILIDEAQNLSLHEVKTIVSRVGHDTKVVLVGDIEQIDNPRLNASNNGLVNLVDAFKGQKIYGHVFLEKTERSPLAELAVSLL
ncbi:MAG: PhoH family protein [Desulfitobacteriaceae bacterium]|nr:PhoH family protein [Desulfitobacteriaceae bacterium]